MTGKSLILIAEFANIGNLALVILGFFQSIWICFLVAQFRIEYLWAAAFFLALFVLVRKWKSLFLAVSCLLLNLLGMQVWTFFPAAEANNNRQTDVHLRLLEMNVEYTNSRYDQARKLIRESNADLVVIEELTPLWLAALSDVLKDYQYRVLEPLDNPYGNGVFSKIPVQNSEIGHSGPKNHPTIKVDLLSNGKSLSLIHTHLQGPVSPANYDQHQADAREAARLLEPSNTNAIFCGDMNSSSWCSPLSKVAGDGNMRESCKLPGMQLSWPTKKRFPYFPILAIDHCFTRGEVKVESCEIGPDFGSDHFPLILDFSISNK